MKRPIVAVLIAVFATIVVGALCYFLLVGPKKGELDKKQKEIESTENKIESEKNTYKKLVDIKNRSAEYEARLASLQSKIPKEPELPSLIRNLQAAADVGTGAGLPWLSFSPGAVSGGGEGGVSSYTFSMAVAGFYDEVVDLVYRLESMQRAVAITSIALSATESILDMSYSPNLGLVEAAIEATTYTFAQPVGAAAPAEATPKPSGEEEVPEEEKAPEEVEKPPEVEQP
ncbi:MAG: type 4a pilus biogenesis protein PilO [Actinobacteria bacterium]|nr:type 4a pilus biogenesis protein PilO [Actinomycetota bacterium]